MTRSTPTAQGAEPFMQAADRYLNLFRELADSLAERVERLAAPERETIGGKLCMRKRGQCSRAHSEMDRGQRAGAKQGKLKVGATQIKFRAGAHQLKYENAMTPGSPGRNNMLNPQPLPPKQGIGVPGAAGVQLPAVQ